MSAYCFGKVMLPQGLDKQHCVRVIKDLVAEQGLNAIVEELDQADQDVLNEVNLLSGNGVFWAICDTPDSGEITESCNDARDVALRVYKHLSMQENFLNPSVPPEVIGAVGGETRLGRVLVEMTSRFTTGGIALVDGSIESLVEAPTSAVASQILLCKLSRPWDWPPNNLVVWTE